MTGFATLGAAVIALVIAVGVYWLVANVTFKGNATPRYTYHKDENGNESVKGNKDE